MSPRTLTALARGRRWFLALQLLDAVEAAGTVTGDAVTVAALATAESWEWGLRSLLRATEKGMRPWMGTWDHLADGVWLWW